MKLVLGIGTACLIAGLASSSAFAQPTPPAAPTAPQAHAAVGMQPGEAPHLGVGGIDITADRAKALKLREESGVEVTEVEPDSGAAKAGLKQGDVVLEFNGQKVAGWEELMRLVRETPVHREVKIVVWRNGAEQTLTATMGAQRGPQLYFGGGNMPGWVQTMPTPAAPPNTPRPSPQFDLPRIFTMMGSASLGIMGESLGQESQLAEFFGVKEGVLVRSVNKDSAAEKAGIKAGDVITKIDDTNISTSQQISGALRAARNKGTVNVTVIRNKKEMTVTVTPDAGGGFHGGLWEPQDNILLQLFQAPQPAKIIKQ
jgi:serine protease Do